jgi:FkbM family methyltransferase
LNNFLRKLAYLFPSNLRRNIKTSLTNSIVKVLNNKIISYSQAGEDYNIRNFFREKKNGFYVDVGAFHPLNVSNTCYFYTFENWKGINIDPNPQSIEIFKKYRKRDINLNIGISSYNKELNYYILDYTSSMNTFNREGLEEAGLLDKIKEVKKISVMTLNEVLIKYLPKGQEIDFLNIDTEGMEIEVLESNDWQRFRPKLVVIESELQDLKDIFETRITKLMQSYNYEPQIVTYLDTKLRNVIYFDSQKSLQLTSKN